MCPADPSHTGGVADPPHTVAYDVPNPRDGAELWRIARDSRTLDLNSPYMYLLGASHFADTSVVARADGRAVGFVWGYLRPDAPDTVFVWQVAVDPSHRGRSVARGMLSALVERLRPRGCRYLEASVTPDNPASAALFRGYARQAGAPVQDDRELFGAGHFPPGTDHQAEVLFRIGPL